jgi:NAD(P)-dependent dehydrogenase (short-subunit alcohol dehydrogenase family)
MSSPRLTSLQDKLAILTGAGGSLGREYALLLASYGAKVVVNDYRGTLDAQRGTMPRAAQVVEEIQSSGGSATASGHDISTHSEVQAMVSEAVAKYGTVHIFVNNAGTSGQFSSHDNINVDSFRPCGS